MNSSVGPVLIHGISERRYNAIAGWTRGPLGPLVAPEVAWLELKPERVLGTLFVDPVDKEIWSAVLAPDLAGCFRGVEILGPHADVREAAEVTGNAMLRVHQEYETVRTQGDENTPVDFFADISPEEDWAPNFKYLREERGAIAARRIIQRMMRWYENQDGNFVEQFQTAAFDARIWELYIWATLRESGYAVNQPDPAPDFHAQGFGESFFVEATTANPPPVDKRPPQPETPEEIYEYKHNYLPTRFSGPLFSKLQKRYWDRPGLKDSPLVFAVQDFHSDLSMTYSQPALYEYLYGIRIDHVENDGRMSDIEVPVQTIVWGEKTVPSGFFKLPDSEHVSAVIANASGTLTKFNRMGIAAGMGEDFVTLIHSGTRFTRNNSGAIEPFSTQVEEGYKENWIDGLTVFHNPHALNPLPISAFPGAAHIFEKDGLRTQNSPSGHLVGSMTQVITSAIPDPL